MSDILIALDCDKKRTSQSNLGFNYKHTKESQNFLAGSQSFLVKEIEIYQLNA